MEFIEEIWEDILGLTSQFVIPDWGALILLLPVLLGILVVIYLIWIFRKLRRAPKPRRGKARLDPLPPSGVHMPGPSYAPIFISVAPIAIVNASPVADSHTSARLVEIRISATMTFVAG